MPNRINSYKVICGGGLNTNDNSLTLSDYAPGAATRLVNYETALSGGYRRLSGYKTYDNTYGEVAPSTAEGPVLGAWILFNTTTDDYEVIAARKDQSSNTYSFYELTVSGWVAYTTGITHATTDGGFRTVTRVRAELFNFGDVNMIGFVDGVNPLVIYNGTNWYECTSTNTGGSGSPGGNQIIDKPSIITSFKNHLFISGDGDDPSIVSYCAPSDALTWTAAAGGGQLIYSYEVVAMKPFRDENFIFGKNNIKRAVPDVTSGFVLQDVTNNLGCIARDSVVEVGGNLLFLSADGIRPIAGTDRQNDVELSLLSQAIQYTVDQFTENYDMSDLVAVTLREKTQFRYFFSGSTDTVSDAYGLIGCLRKQAEGSWEFSELTGIRANCAWSGFVDSREIILHGDYDGYLYQQEQTNSFNGADITSVYTTPYLDVGDTEIRKLMRKLNTFIRAEGSVDFNISVRFDWGNENVAVPNNYIGESVAGPITYGGGSEYDDGSTYGGATRNVLATNIQGSCFSVQFSYVTIGGAPFTMQGFVVEFSGKGRE
jgi:hypothetical protein